MGHAPQTTFVVHVRRIAGGCLEVGCAARSVSLHAVRGRAIAGLHRHRLTQLALRGSAGHVGGPHASRVSPAAVCHLAATR